MDAETKVFYDVPVVGGCASDLPIELDFFANSRVSGREVSRKRGRIDPDSARKKVHRTTVVEESFSREQLDALQRLHRIRVFPAKSKDGKEVDVKDLPALCPSFWKMAESGWLSRRLSKRCTALFPEGPLPIQMMGIPLLASGSDCLCVAPTGSGKSLAYLLPILSKLETLEEDSSGVRVFIVCPTRELAQQVLREVRRLLGRKCHRVRAEILSKRNVAEIRSRDDRDSGSDDEKGNQKRVISDSLRNSHVVVSTPAQLATVLSSSDSQGTLSLERVETIVFDEADELFARGFVSFVDEIVSKCLQPFRSENHHKREKKKRSRQNVQICLFSATMSSHVETLATSVMSRPVCCYVGARNVPVASVEQRLLFTSEEGKLLALSELLHGGVRLPALVFCESKDRASDLFREVALDGDLKVGVLHSDLSGSDRQAVVASFREGKIWIIICTDVIARGVDFKGVRSVINYDCPSSAISYIHRVGRSGRAGAPGEAVTLYTEQDAPLLRPLIHVMRQSGCSDLPSWLTSDVLPKPRRASDRKRKNVVPDRPAVTEESKYDRKIAAKQRMWIAGTKEKKEKHEKKPEPS